jgi:Zn-dependent peptidase ImmA (M78 family)
MHVRRRNHIREKIAALLLERGITAPKVPVHDLAKAQNIDVRIQNIDEDISGFLFRHGSQAIIGVNKNQHEVRRRFTIAHELGHFFLHGGQGLQEVHIDRVGKLKLRGPSSSQGIDPEEVEANFFAAELLMPTKFLEQEDCIQAGLDLSSDDNTAEIGALANKYGVSSQAMTIRLGNLGWVNLQSA